MYVKYYGKPRKSLRVSDRPDYDLKNRIICHYSFTHMEVLLHREALKWHSNCSQWQVSHDFIQGHFLSSLLSFNQLYLTIRPLTHTSLCYRRYTIITQEQGCCSLPFRLLSFTMSFPVFQFHNNQNIVETHLFMPSNSSNMNSLHTLCCTKTLSEVSSGWFVFLSISALYSLIIKIKG